MTSKLANPSSTPREWELTSTTGTALAVPSADVVSIAWLVRLRWIAVAVQTVLAAVHVFALKNLPDLMPLAACVGFTVASNFLLSRHAAEREGSSRLPIVGALVLDVVLLTVMLHATGGAMNPFSVFYIVHVALAAVLLDVRGAWAFAAVTCVAFASLFLGGDASDPAAMADMHAGHDMHVGHDMHGAASMEGAATNTAMAHHLEGMWLSYSLAAALVGYFVATVARSLERRERELAFLRERSVRAEQMAVLGELAASAAHELGTPLATIAVIAKELENTRRESLSPEAVRGDAITLRQEAERCKAILARMSVQSGELPGEVPTDIPPTDFLEDLAAEVGSTGWASVRATTAGAGALRGPRRALVHSVANLVRNGLEASEATSVEVHIALGAAEARIEVRDHGTGIAAEDIDRVGSPFFSRKDKAQHGMGLGLFLVRNLAERLGGTLSMRTAEGQGTTVTLRLPTGGPVT